MSEKLLYCHNCIEEVSARETDTRGEFQCTQCGQLMFVDEEDFDFDE